MYKKVLMKTSVQAGPSLCFSTQVQKPPRSLFCLAAFPPALSQAARGSCAKLCYRLAVPIPQEPQAQGARKLSLCLRPCHPTVGTASGPRRGGFQNPCLAPV